MKCGVQNHWRPQKNFPCHSNIFIAFKCGDARLFPSGLQRLQWLMCRFLCQTDLKHLPMNSWSLLVRLWLSTARGKKLRSRQCWRNFEPLTRQNNYSIYSILNIFNWSKLNANDVQFDNLQKPKHAGATQSLDQWSWSCHTDVVSNGTEFGGGVNIHQHTLQWTKIDG